MGVKHSYLLALLIAITLISGCISSANEEPPSLPPDGANEVNINEFSFDPGMLIVKAGTIVTWTNSDTISHTIISDSQAFKSGNLGFGNTYSYRFSIPGTYSYQCGLHPDMRATIVVQ